MGQPAKSFDYIRVTEGPVTEITIDRPNALNALNRQVLQELHHVLQSVRHTAAARCVIITGAGPKAFVAGADIAEMARLTPAEAESFAEMGQRVFAELESLPMPTVAAVNGFALGGGCELVLCCDVVLASETAKFGQPEVKLGIMPGFGGTVRLPRKIGHGAACQWIFTGDMFSAQQAHAVGLVQQVTAPAELLPRARDMAQSIAKRAPLAVRASKRVMVQEADSTVACAWERMSFGQLFTSRDTREGTNAFVDKREAVFTGE